MVLLLSSRDDGLLDVLFLIDIRWKPLSDSMISETSLISKFDNSDDKYVGKSDAINSPKYPLLVNVSSSLEYVAVTLSKDTPDLRSS